MLTIRILMVFKNKVSHVSKCSNSKYEHFLNRERKNIVLLFLRKAQKNTAAISFSKFELLGVIPKA
jgi:hypothetical protein